MLGGYGYKYVSQAIVAEEHAESQNIDLNGQPGTRVPHLWVEYRGERCSTGDLAVHCFVLLAGPDGDAWCAAARSVAEGAGIEVKAYRVAPDGDVLQMLSGQPKRAYRPMGFYSYDRMVLWHGVLPICL
jgi:putative polyketide hydroxylase